MFVLKVLPPDYKYLIQEEKYTSKGNFECKLRLRGINTAELARIKKLRCCESAESTKSYTSNGAELINHVTKWITELSASSMVTWKIARTYPNSGKINIYKAEFRCQHKVSGKQKLMKRSKNTNCPAMMRVCIRRYLKGSTSKDLDPLTKLWPCIIELRNVHNHSIYCAEALQYRPIHENTRDKIGELFKRGHSPASVVEMLKIEIMLENPGEYTEKSCDTSFVPLTSYCYREYTKIYGHNYRNRDKVSTQTSLEAMLGSYINEAHGGRAALPDQTEHVVFAICTPLMQRVHKLVPQSKELMIVRCHGHMDKRSRLFIISTPTSIGELPLGVIVSDTENMDVFKIGLELLKRILPADSFYGLGYPMTIIVDDDGRKKIPLEMEFPSSMVISNQLNVLRHVWEFISDDKNGIERIHRQSLFKKFKSLVYATDETDLEEKFQACIRPGNLGDVRYEQFIQFLLSLWNERVEWASPFRENLLANVSFGKTNNYVEIISRLLDENLIQRTKSFSLVQLADFVTTHFETYFTKRMTDSSAGGYIDAQLKLLLPSCGIIALQKIKKIETSLYEVPSESGSDMKHYIDLDLGLCSCTVGSSGKICKHQSAAIQKYNIGQNVFVLMPGSAERKLYYEVGTGEKEPEEDFNWLVTPMASVPRLDHEPKLKPKPVVKDEPGSSSGSRRRIMDIKDPDNYVECTEEEVNEGREVAKEISTWLHSMLDSHPAKFIPALKTMWRNINQFANTEDTAASAMHQFGKENSGGFAIISSPGGAQLEMENLISSQQTAEISFISTQEQDESLAQDMELVSVDHQDYIQTLPGESPRYLNFILVTDNSGTEGQIPVTMATSQLNKRQQQIVFSTNEDGPRKNFSRKQ